MIGQHIEYCIGRVKDAFDNQVEGGKSLDRFSCYTNCTIQT